jgi:putative membrane-bound dehydrogenase-like protein
VDFSVFSPAMRSFKLAFLIGACTATLVGQQPQPSRPADVPTLPDRGPLTIEPAAAAEILAGVKAPPGFRVSVFAAPPIVNYPTCVTATLTGELYVCVDRNSSLQTDPEMGSILRLVDRDKDGRADEYTVFVRIDSPRGAVFDGDTLYVTHPPFVSALRDTNGDGISDETRTLVRGLGFGLDFRGADHTTNGLEFGPDGWLYVAVGDYGFVKAVGADGRELQLRGGGNVRVRPDGTELEIYAVGTRNDYDVAIDPFLNLFARGNTNDGGGWDIRLNHFVAGGNFGYPSLFRNFGDEVLQPLADYGGGSGAGMLFVQDPGLPAEYGNTLYSVDWGTNTIYRHPLTAKGATFTAGQEIFTTLPRPTDLAIDGASRLYAASWRGGQYRYGGEQIGFIAQLTATAGKASEPPDLKAATDARLVEVLVSGNQVHRRFAQHEILRRGRSPERVSLVERQLAGRAELAGRVAAIYTLKQLAGQDATAALLAAAGDPALRRHALRALADRRTELAGVSAETFVRALKDPDPTVQLQAITGLKRLGTVEAAGAILPLTTSADAVVSHVAIDALVSLAAIQPSLAVVATGSPAQARAALRVLQRLHTVPTVSGLIELLPRIKDGETRAHALQALARLYHRDGVWRGTLPEWWGTRPDTTGPYYDPVAWDQSPRILPVLRQAILQAPTTAPAETTRLLSDLTRNRVMPTGATEVISALHAARDTAQPTVVDALLGRMRLEIDAGNAGLFAQLSARAAYRAAVVRMIAAGSPPSPRAAEILHRAAVDATTEPEARAAALVALMSASDPRARDRAIDAFVTIDPAPGLHPALDRAWRQFVGSPTHAQNVAAFRSLAGAPEPARQVLGYAVLLQLAAEPAAGGRGARGGGRGGRGQGAAAADAARAEARTAVDAAWSGASVAALVRAIGLTQASGYTARIQALIQAPATPADVRAAAQFAASHSRDTTTAAGATLVSAVAYEELAARVGALKGDPELGRTMFTRQGCSACHTASPEETEKGPFLGGIGTRYSVAEIVESIVRPNAKVAQGFATTWFDTKDGKQVQGFVVREGNLDVVIRDLAGVETTLMKTQITARGVREGSVMPTGLVDTLTLQELASLLAYMSAPGAK